MSNGDHHAQTRRHNSNHQSKRTQFSLLLDDTTHTHTLLAHKITAFRSYMRKSQTWYGPNRKYIIFFPYLDRTVVLPQVRSSAQRSYNIYTPDCGGAHAALLYTSTHTHTHTCVYTPLAPAHVSGNICAGPTPCKHTNHSHACSCAVHTHARMCTTYVCAFVCAPSKHNNARNNLRARARALELTRAHI